MKKEERDLSVERGYAVLHSCQSTHGSFWLWIGFGVEGLRSVHVERVRTVRRKRGESLLEDSSMILGILETVGFAGRNCEEYEEQGQNEASIQRAEL